MFAEVERACPDVARLLDPEHAAVLTIEEALAITGRPSLDPEGEGLLAERVAEMVFVTDWPASARPFYTLESLERPGLTVSFDLILRGLEVTTGGQREHRPEPLAAAMARRGLDATGFGFYLEAFALGMPPHGGFAIGLERLMGLPNVRQAPCSGLARIKLATLDNVRPGL